MKLVDRLYPEQYSPRWQYNFTAVLYVFSAAFLALAVVFAVQFVQSQSDARDSVQLDVWNKADKAATAVDAWFEQTQTVISELGASVAAGKATMSDVDSDLPGLIRENPSIRSAGFFAGPSEKIPEPRLVVYRRPSDRRGDITARRSEEDVASVTAVGGRYRSHLELNADGTVGWGEPVKDEDSGLMFVPFVYPVSTSSGPGANTEFIFAEVSLGSLSNILGWTILGEAGFQFLTDSDLNIVLHTDSQLADSRTDLSEATGIGRERLDRLLSNSPGSGISLSSYGNEVDGKAALLSLHQIPSTDWKLGYVALESQVLTRSVASKQALMRLSAAALGFLFFLLIVLTRSYAGSLGGLWLLALITGVLFTSGILVIWYLFATTPTSTEPTRIDLVDAIAAHKSYLAEEFDGLESIDIEAGIALTSVDFTKLGSTIANADEAIVSGFVWWNCVDCARKGRDNGGGDFGGVQPISPGFFFPEAREVNIEPTLNFRQGLDFTTVYEFSAIISRDFQPDRYPFDTDNVTLRLWPVDFDLETLLIPDVADYKSLIQTDKPGLATDFSIAGWNTEGTFFSYDVVNYNTTFGMQSGIGTTNSTELLFNISVRRNFINAFITNILPVVIIIALLFHVLLITPKTETYVLAFASGAKSEGAGGTGSPTYTLIATSMVLGYTSALLFAVILAHSRLRTEIPADGILYLEFFYFAAYFSILAVTMNVLAFASHRGGWLIHFRDNLIPRVAFWPLLTLFLFTVSFVSFY